MSNVVGRADAAGYFAINDKPTGVSTSYRVSGRRGELGRRWPLFADAQEDCKRLNKAYLIGLKDGMTAAQPPLPSDEERSDTGSQQGQSQPDTEDLSSGDAA